MYWNVIGFGDVPAADMININMRCIEILTAWGIDKWYGGLTLTWDVLKLTMQTNITIA